jgi:hypothetical protein
LSALPTQLTDSRTNDDLVDVLMSLREEAEQARKVVESARFWKDVEDSYYNRLLQDFPTPEWMSREVAPMTWAAVEHVVPTLTDSRPRLLINGRGPEDQLAVKYLTLAVQQEEDRQGMPVFWGKSVRDTAIGGTSFVLTRVEMVNGRFRLRTESLSRWSVFADPSATSDVDLGWVWIKRMVRGSRLCQHFPDKAAEIMDRASNGKISGSSPSMAAIAANGISPNPTWGSVGQLGSLEFQEITRTSGRANPLNQYYELWEGYFADRTMIPLELAMEQQSGAPSVIHPMDETGAIVTMVGDLIVHAIDNPFSHGDIPLTRAVCYDLPGQYYGMSFIESLLGPHRMLTRIDNKVVDQMTLAGDPVIIMDDDSGLDGEDDYQAPGKHLPLKPGSRYEIVPAAPLPQYYWNLRAAKAQDFKDATGQQDVNRGQVSGSSEDMSGKAIDLLQEPGERRLRLFQRNFESTVSRWGRQTVSNLIQFKSREDWLRLLPPGTQQLPWDGWKPDDFREWPDVSMAVGSSLPVNKTARQNAIIQKLQAGLYGRPNSVDAVRMANEEMESPSTDDVVKSMQADMEQAKSAGLPPAEQAKAYSEVITAVAAFIAATSKGGTPPADADAELSSIGLPGLGQQNPAMQQGVPAGLAGAATNKAMGAEPAPGTEVNPNGQGLQQP